MAAIKRREPTRVGRETAQTGNRRTKFYPGGATPRAGGVPGKKQGDSRRIVGVLISYTWEPGGQLFEVREGRTHLGSGEIKDDAGHTAVEVQCPQDSMLSADHALILVQQGQFYISDLSSTNGTFLNGKPLRPEIVEDLPSPAEIKAGNTVFTFVKFDAAPAVASAAPPEEPETARDTRQPPTILK